MNLKLGVDMNGIQPQILRACADIHSIMEATGQFTVTACLDGRHMNGSLHYKGRAVDIRSKHMTKEQKYKVLDAICLKLGPEFQCFLENEGLDQEHLHLEWDVK